MPNSSRSQNCAFLGAGRTMVVAVLLVVGLFSPLALGQAGSRAGRGGSDSAGPLATETSEKRKAQRFDVVSYLTNQRRIRAEQDARLPKSDSWAWFNPDFVISLRGQIPGQASPIAPSSLPAERGSLTESQARVQLLLNGLFSEGSARRAINLDLGIEIEAEQSRLNGREASALPVLSDGFERRSASLLLRPFGRSSQDTMLMGRIGLTQLSLQQVANLSLTGSLQAQSLSWGAEARLYLLPIFGLHLDWTQIAPMRIDGWQAEVQANSTRAGVFAELGFVQLGINWVERILAREESAVGSRTSERRVAIEGELSFFF